MSVDGFITQLKDKKKAEEGLKGLQGMVDTQGSDKGTVVDLITALPEILECAAAKEKPVAQGADKLARGIIYIILVVSK